MYRARSLASALVAALVSAAALAGVVWAGAELAARGTSQAILPTLLTTGSFAGLEWPFRVDQPPTSVHVTFYVSVVLVALVAGLVTLLAARKASPRNGAAALFGTWFGVVLGCVLAALVVYFIRIDALAASAGARNEVLASLLSRFAFGGLLVGLIPALLSWVAFKVANRSRAAEYVEAMDLADGKNVNENPFDLAPGSIGDSRPVEPGFTYPAGEHYTDGSYRDADLPPSERRTGTMTFSDVTDATGEDFSDGPRASEPANDAPRPVADFIPSDGTGSGSSTPGATSDETAPGGAASGATATSREPESDDVRSRAGDYGYHGDRWVENALRKTGS